MNQILETRALAAKSSKRYFQSAPCRVYTAAEIYGLLKISRRTFFDWKRQGKLPLVEVRVGRTVRYHALPIDRLLEGHHAR